MMNAPTTFETQRLILRITSEEDASFLVELLNTPKWLQYIGDRGVRTIEDGEKYVRERITPQFKRLGFSNFTVIRKSDGAKIGCCGLYDREGLEGVDLGFAFLPQYEKKGYAFESAQRVLEIGIQDFGIEKIQAITVKENIDSQKLLEKLGFQYKELLMMQRFGKLIDAKPRRFEKMKILCFTQFIF